MERGITEDGTDAEIVDDRPDAEIVEDEGQSQLRIYVAMMTLEVLVMCGAIKGVEEDVWASRTQRLVNKTMERLPERSVPSMTPKKMAKHVFKELRVNFSRRLVKHMLLLEDPVLETVIAKCFQSYIQGLPKRKRSYKWCKYLFNSVFTVLVVAGIIGIGFLVFNPRILQPA
ncbi:hypothetical protein F2P81_009132 [Scophthalmus maximus]|nr:hypothetical protein F2P81_009132 [Scophthalmus maximus]